MIQRNNPALEPGFEFVDRHFAAAVLVFLSEKLREVVQVLVGDMVRRELRRVGSWRFRINRSLAQVVAVPTKNRQDASCMAPKILIEHF